MIPDRTAARLGLMIGLGGAVGALARYGVLSAGGEEWSYVGLLACNTLGSFLLGLVVIGWPNRADQTRTGLGVGFCGGFTSLSTFAVQVADLLWKPSDGRASAALIALTTGGALGGLLAGQYLGHRNLGRRDLGHRDEEPKGRPGGTDRP